MDNSPESNGLKPDEKTDAEKKESNEKPKDQIDESIKSDDLTEIKKENNLPDENVNKTEEKKDIQDESQPVKTESKKKASKDKKDDDFQYIVRIANTDIDGNKKVVYGLTMIKGVGIHIANLIIDNAEIDKNIKIGDLSEPQIEKIRKTLENLNEIAPGWMLNHRKDNDTGEDIHLIGSDIDMRLRDEINIMKKIRSYRGIRHERSLRVRGQRTRANNRTGLTLGVSKKSAQAKSTGSKE